VGEPSSAEQYITLQACVDLFKKAFLMLPPQVLRYTEEGKTELPLHQAGRSCGSVRTPTRSPTSSSR